MDVFEINIVVKVKKQIEFKYGQEKLSRFINRALLNSDTLKKIHKKNTYKYYVFNNLYPIEKSGIYKENSNYIFNIRTIKENLKQSLIDSLQTLNEDDYFIIQRINSKELSIKQVIEKLYSITPVVITSLERKGFIPFDAKPEYVIKRIESNLIKKYRELNGENSIPYDYSCIEYLKVLNRGPIVTKYKNTNIGGNRYRLYFKNDEISQNLAKLAIGTGVGEKNASFGAGYCSYDLKMEG